MLEQTRIVLVDDHELMRAGVQARLGGEPAIKVVGEAACGRTALSLAEQLKPDLIVTDISMEDMGGLDLVKALQASHLKIRCLIFSMHGGFGYVERAKEAGACGYVVKDGPSEELCRAIRAIASGESYFPPTTHTCPLSPREREMVPLICRGLRNKDIADELGITEHTVKTHREHIRDKLGLDTVAELIAYARKHGLIDD